MFVEVLSDVVLHITLARDRAGPGQTAANRAEVRKRCFMAATISFNKGLTTCACVIRNLSESGARLDVNDAVSLPTFFHLHIPAQQKQLHVEL